MFAFIFTKKIVETVPIYFTIKVWSLFLGCIYTRSGLKDFHSVLEVFWVFGSGGLIVDSFADFATVT